MASVFGTKQTPLHFATANTLWHRFLAQNKPHSTLQLQIPYGIGFWHKTNPTPLCNCKYLMASVFGTKQTPLHFATANTLWHRFLAQNKPHSTLQLQIPYGIGFWHKTNPTPLCNCKYLMASVFGTKQTPLHFATANTLWHRFLAQNKPHSTLQLQIPYGIGFWHKTNPTPLCNCKYLMASVFGTKQTPLHFATANTLMTLNIGFTSKATNQRYLATITLRVWFILPR